MRSRFLAILCLAVACSADTAETPVGRADPLSESADGSPGSSPAVTGGNILLLIADDLGVDKLKSYGEKAGTPPTPNLDALAAGGLLFRNAWSLPACSPTRASILTGRYGRRTGQGRIIRVSSGDYELPLAEQSVPEMLDAGTGGAYDHSLVGKWHLAGYASPSGLRHPLLSGFNWSGGSFANLKQASLGRGGQGAGEFGYSHWEKVTNGVPAITDAYATTDTVDDALARIRAMPSPWFLWVAFNAPHTPLHVPPRHLHSADIDESSTPEAKYDAMVEALDSEIGRLLAGIDPETRARTTILFVGDNGTPSAVLPVRSDVNRGKETLYEGGINVPLIVAGPAVSTPGAESDALVSTVDIFSTIAELAGVSPDAARTHTGTGSPRALDGIGLLPYLENPSLPSLRRYLYAERFGPNGSDRYDIDLRGLRDERWKLITVRGVPDEFYDLAGRAEEGPNLLAGELDADQAEAYARLSARMTRIVSGLSADSPADDRQPLWR